LRTAIPATWPTVTVFSLSVSTWVGAPPNARKVASKQAINVGSVRSQQAITTRNRDQASQAQNSDVARPAIVGPAPQSNCNQPPGSGIHGRNTRRCPERNARLAAAVSRRVVRPDPW